MVHLSMSSLPGPRSQIDFLFFLFYPSWANNCVATNNTNGVDRRSSSGLIAQSRPRLARAVVSGPSAVISPAVDLPEQFSPSLTPTNGSTGFLKSYILPGSKTGVVRCSCYFCVST
jgi:hypothetical protein